MSESVHAAAPMSLDEAATVLDDLLPVLTEVATTADIPTTVCDRLERLAETLGETIQVHADRFDALEADNNELRSTVATIQTRLDESTAHIETLESQIADLQAELRDERETRAREAAEDRKRIHEVETQVEEATDDETTDTSTDPDTEPDTEATDSRVQPPETPLEEVIRVPEHLVKEHLTANQRRARFVATDVHEYTQRVPAGYAIRSSQLRRVLTAGEDARIYTQTVSRVLEFLDDLGGDAVKVRESKRGERVVVFTESLVERIRTYQHMASNTVGTGTEVVG